MHQLDSRRHGECMGFPGSGISWIYASELKATARCQFNRLASEKVKVTEK